MITSRYLSLLRALSRAGFLLPLLLVTACSTVPVDRPGLIGDFADNRHIQYWQLRGKIGIRNHRQATSAYLNWQQCSDHFDIRLSGPLGQGSAHLYGDSHRATLQQNKKQVLTSGDPSQLLYQQLGWPIPVRQLPYWIRGIPAPSQEYHTDNHGFTQSGWQISYPKTSDVEHYQLPAKVVATQAQFTVTLILKNWNLQPVCNTTAEHNPIP